MSHKILMILTEFPPSFGGMQTHAEMLSKYFHAKGNELIVYTYQLGSNVDECIQTDSKFPFKINRILSRISYFYNVKLLQKEIEKHRPELIYSSTIYFGILNKLTKVPVVCRSVGNDIMRPWIVYPFKFGSAFVASRFFEKIIFRRIDNLKTPDFIEALFHKKRCKISVNSAKESSNILANSEYTENCLLEKGILPNSIKIIVGGVDIKLFQNTAGLCKIKLRNQLNIPVNKTIILTACRLVEKKKVDFLIRFFAQLFSDNSNLHLLIVGNGYKLNTLKNLTEELQIQNHVTFTGAVNISNMPEYYWASDIFILASAISKNKLTGLPDAETMGRVLCEANAAGLPVIAAMSGGIPSVITDNENGLLFRECDEMHLKEKFSMLLSDPVLREKLISQGFKKAEEIFDWSVVLKEHEKVFSEVLK